GARARGRTLRGRARSRRVRRSVPAVKPGGLRVVVAGMLAATPGHGGASWAVLQYLLGLRKLGHDVWFFEPVAPRSIRTDSDVRQYFEGIIGRFGLQQWLLVERATGAVLTDDDAWLSHARNADLLIDLAGTHSRYAGDEPSSPFA